MDILKLEYKNMVFMCDSGSTFIEYREYYKDQQNITQKNTNYFNSVEKVNNIEDLKRIVYKNF